MRRWSLGKLVLLRELSGWRKRYERYEIVIVRIVYGLSLIFAAVTVKFLHPAITIRVIQGRHLTQFRWLFPSDPVLLTLGAGIAETAIGFLIIIGFQLRLTVLISLFYLMLSIIYFKEAVWPHLLWYGISISLLVQSETFSFDSLLFTWLAKRNGTKPARVK